jgi:ATP-dependent Zn protease
MAELKMLGGTTVMQAAADVAASRERARRARVRKLIMVTLLVVLWWCARALAGNPVRLGPPHLSAGMMPLLPPMILVLMLGVMILGPMIGMGRSPHVLYRPSEIDISLDDVKGAGVVVDEIVKTLNLFLSHKTFKERMGGTPRRAMLFEGPPGTGKTYMAKAMAREAGVPFLFVSSSAFQSMYYGQTNRKIRSYFKALRAYARREGGAIGFIEEIDAIGAARSGMGGSNGREGISGVVNELLIQLQSFDQPTRSGRVYGWLIDLLNRWIPAQRQLRKPKPHQSNILIIGATNRATDLDPALVRPGRFDRSVYFGLPSRTGRREIIDYYLDKKAHEPELDDDDRRESLAAQTSGYSPVMLEHVLDEALVWALRRGAERMAWEDVQRAKLTEEIGLGQPVEYTEAERRTIATHESGHATVAYLAGTTRKLDVLSIIKRADALGLMGHSEKEERFLRTQAEIEAHIQIALGGMVAEELFFGEITSGPSADLAAATTAAALMVGGLGMAGSLLSYEAVQTGANANLTAKVVATDEGRERVEAILVANKATAEKLLDDNRHIVEALRDALLDREELIAGEILDVIHAAEREARGQILDLRR